MIHKAEIIVERFEQGITVRWRDIDGNIDPSKALAMAGNEYSIIGKEVWDDVFEIFDKTLADKVLVKLEYEEVK